MRLVWMPSLRWRLLISWGNHSNQIQCATCNILRSLYESFNSKPMSWTTIFVVIVALRGSRIALLLGKFLALRGSASEAKHGPQGFFETDIWMQSQNISSLLTWCTEWTISRHGIAVIWDFYLRSVLAHFNNQRILCKDRKGIRNIPVCIPSRWLCRLRRYHCQKQAYSRAGESFLEQSHCRAWWLVHMLWQSFPAKQHLWWRHIEHHRMHPMITSPQADVGRLWVLCCMTYLHPVAGPTPVRHSNSF